MAVPYIIPILYYGFMGNMRGKGQIFYLADNSIFLFIVILYLNPNRRNCYKILLRKCLKCDCVITGTPKCARKRWRGQRHMVAWPAGSGAGVRDVRGSKPGEAITLLLTLFRVR